MTGDIAYYRSCWRLRLSRLWSHVEVPSLEAVSLPRKGCEIEEKSSEDTTDYKCGMGYGETECREMIWSR